MKMRYDEDYVNLYPNLDYRQGAAGRKNGPDWLIKFFTFLFWALAFSCSIIVGLTLVGKIFS